MKKTPGKLKVFIIGLFMGIGDLVPGVGGGVIAFATGIFDDLVLSLKQATNDFPKLFLTGKFKESFKYIDFCFLIPLLAGILISVFSMSKFISWSLSNYSIFVWSLFLGLILASAFIILKRIKNFDYKLFLVTLLGIFLSLIITMIVPVETPLTLFYVLISGILGALALLLPGVSGSLILVIIGKYEQIVDALSNRDLFVISVFIVGIIFGLAIFSRFINWFIMERHDIAMALLGGFMIGSLRAIWPWSSITNIDSSIIISACLFIIGFSLIVLADKLSLINEN